MFINNINPDLFSIGPFSVRFYGIVYALGFVLVTYLLSKQAHKIKNLDKDKAVDLVMYLLIFGLIGARIFHVVSDFHLYKNNLLGMFAIWNGGLGFYGGLIGGLIAAYVYSKKHKINMMQVLDVISVPMPLIIAFGRIANFMNSEHIGLPANHALCVVYQKIDEVCRHPAQLYESASMFILFGIMLYFSKKKKNPGFLFWSFIISYGILRILTDFFRSDYSIFFLGLSHTQIISILMLGISFYFIRKTKK